MRKFSRARDGGASFPRGVYTGRPDVLEEGGTGAVVAVVVVWREKIMIASEGFLRGGDGLKGRAIKVCKRLEEKVCLVLEDGKRRSVFCLGVRGTLSVEEKSV